MQGITTVATCCGALIATLFGAVSPVLAAEASIGINRVNLAWLPADARQRVLADMAANNVRLIRLSLTAPFANSLDAVRIASGLGMRILLEIPLGTPAFYRREVAKRPGHGRVWDMYRLSDIDVDAFRTAFAAALHEIDRQGIVLAAIQPGNELNWGGYNGDLHVYPDAHQHTARTVAELRNPSGFAAGLDRYVEIVRVIREELSTTRANRSAQIITAGVADTPIEIADARAMERVDAHTFIAMLRARGIERYIDAYGIHVYPGTTAMPIVRRRHVDAMLASCAAPGQGTPCWITEWGLANTSSSCPLDDNERARAVRDVRRGLEEQIASGRVSKAFYFDWDSQTPYSVWRCEELTPSGRAAIAPSPAAE